MSKKEVAKWLYDKIISEGTVDQETVVHEIVDKFGDSVTYINVNDNLAIDGAVLREFRKLKGDKIEWDNREKFWYVAEDSDPILTGQDHNLEGLLNDNVSNLLSEHTHDLDELLKDQNNDLEGLL